MDSATPWNVSQADAPPDQAAAGWGEGMPEPIRRVLWNRGLRDAEEVRRFLRPDPADLEDPFLMTDLRPAVLRLRRALEREEPVLVFSDYDVDGLTAAVLWVRTLRRWKAPVTTLVPNRMEEGFGLSPRAVDAAAAAGARLLIASDCGTTAHRAAARAAELGIDIIVADHHIPETVLPPACALVNPRRPGDPYPFPHLAAVGVAFKILQGLIREIGTPEDEQALLDQCDLVALGTVADVVPLRGENRILVHLGLERLRRGPRPCLQAILEKAELASLGLNTSHLAYFIAPRLNASGRLGWPGRALELLLCDDLDTARRAAEAVEKDNRERRKLHLRVLEEASRMLDESVPDGPIVLASAEWHPGVLGIAASRLVDRFRLPAVLVSLQGEVARGSARTPPGIDLLEWFQAAGEQLTTFGGHRQAVGFSLRPERFEEFRAALLRKGVRLPPAPPQEILAVDGELDPLQCDLELVRWMDRLAPFGIGNPEPLFVGRALCQRPWVQQGRHLRFRAGKGPCAVDCIGFGLAERASEIPNGGAVLELVYQPTLNRHRGEERVQLKVREFRLGTCSPR